MAGRPGKLLGSRARLHKARVPAVLGPLARGRHADCAGRGGSDRNPLKTRGDLRKPMAESPVRTARRPHAGPAWTIGVVQGIESMMRSVSQDVPIGSSEISVAQLNDRSREIFRQIVESYLATGEPVGSRNLSRIIPMTLSPASVRNVMQDLERLGLIYAPHTSAGRLPTELGLRFFVDALMQIGDLSEPDRVAIEGQVAAAGKTVENVLTEASVLLSGLTRAAGVVLTAKANVRVKHIEFVRLEPERALVILVAEDGQVENRVLNLPIGLPASALTEASNFLNAHVRGKTLAEAKAELETALEAGRAELDQLTQRIVAAGFASWSGGERDERKLIVRGHANLLDDLKAVEDLERVRRLFDELEAKRGVADLLGRAERAEGVRIYIGSENKLFSLSGSSTIISPYHDASGGIVGVIGVIGPTRLNYARIVPMVDYTAKVVSKLLAPG
jgi:heat-inducible transcriptional repressor